MGKINVGDKFILEVVGSDMFGMNYDIKCVDEHDNLSVPREFLSELPKAGESCSCHAEDDSELRDAVVLGLSIRVLFEMSDADRAKYFGTSDIKEIVIMNPKVVIGGVYTYIEQSEEESSDNDKSFNIGERAYFNEVQSGKSNKVPFIVCEIDGDTLRGICEDPNRKGGIVVETNVSECVKTGENSVEDIEKLMSIYNLAKGIDVLFKKFSRTED